MLRGFLFSQAKGFQRPAVSPILADISLTRSNSEVGPTVRLARAEVPNAGREHGSRKRAAGGQDAEAEYNLPKTRQHPKALRGKLEQNDREFVMVSGELSDHEFLGLLVTACGWIRRERA